MLRFRLNEQEVSNFLADFQYNPDQIVALAATPTPSPVTQSSAQFAQMSTREQNAAITTFRKTMDAWLHGQGMTLADLRDWTGKGNKFLMGIYLE